MKKDNDLTFALNSELIFVEQYAKRIRETIQTEPTPNVFQAAKALIDIGSIRDQLSRIVDALEAS